MAKTEEAPLNNDSEQERLLKFVADKKNIEKAAEGSMNKRMKILNQIKGHSIARNT